MKLITALLTLVLLLPCAAHPAEIRGTVFGPKDEPLARVGVDVSPADCEPRSAVTDDRGRYSVGDLRPGAYTVTARKSSFTQGRQAARVGREDQVLGVSLRIKPWAEVPRSVTGTVLREDGRTPVAGARVALYAGTPGRQVKDATTDEEGFFVLADVPAGGYTLGASAAGCFDWTGAPFLCGRERRPTRRVPSCRRSASAAYAGACCARTAPQRPESG